MIAISKSPHIEAYNAVDGLMRTNCLVRDLMWGDLHQNMTKAEKKSQGDMKNQVCFEARSTLENYWMPSKRRLLCCSLNQQNLDEKSNRRRKYSKL